MNIVSTCTANVVCGHLAICVDDSAWYSWWLNKLLFCRILDNLPLVVPIKRLDQVAPMVYQLGFYVGAKGQPTGVNTSDSQKIHILSASYEICINEMHFMFLQNKDVKYYIHNHLSFLVRYHKDTQLDLARIVGFEVKPFRLGLSESSLFFVCLYFYPVLWFIICSVTALNMSMKVSGMGIRLAWAPVILMPSAPSWTQMPHKRSQQIMILYSHMILNLRWDFDHCLNFDLEKHIAFFKSIHWSWRNNL